MNPLTSNPSAALEMARYTILDQVHTAERRTEVRTARRQARTARASRRAGGLAPSRRATRWAAWFAHPAH
jgi:hypothetical protein